MGLDSLLNLFGASTQECQFDHRMASVRDECLVTPTHLLQNLHGMSIPVCRIIAEDLVNRGYKDRFALCQFCGQQISKCWFVTERADRG